MLWCQRSPPSNSQKPNRGRQQRATSPQQSPLITVSLYIKKKLIRNTKAWVYRGVFITRPSPYLFCVCQRKGTKAEPYWLKTSRTVKQQDTTDRSCMAGIRDSTEKKEHNKRNRGLTNLFYFSFWGERDRKGRKALVIWKDLEGYTQKRQSLLATPLSF